MRDWKKLLCAGILGSSLIIGNMAEVDAQSHNPEGNFEDVSSPAVNQIRVEGWTADRDNMGASLRIHVYVGGGLGSGAESYEIVANKSRTDVRSWFARQGIPAGEFYGFNNVINVKRTGRQEILKETR